MLWCAENESCEFILIARRLVRQGYYFLREHLAIDKFTLVDADRASCEPFQPVAVFMAGGCLIEKEK